MYYSEWYENERDRRDVTIECLASVYYPAWYENECDRRDVTIECLASLYCSRGFKIKVLKTLKETDVILRSDNVWLECTVQGGLQTDI